ncbi:MAG: DUF1330 domain-containing protein [Acidobacteria bacterium]|nr:DUF1330 domain-containing protein [Acidobacteriota bacterium]
MAEATIEPTAEQMKALFAAPDDGPVVMVNLLRYLDTASDGSGRTGREAYNDYSAAVLPMVASRGGAIVYFGTAAPSVIGPEAEQWNDVVLVMYPSRAAFIDMTTSEEYVAVMGHRTAALADSRLIPTTQLPI